MFIIKDNEQGSPDWFLDRIGKVTASIFSKVVTKTGKRSASADEVVNRAVAEIITGKIEESFQSDAMARGSELEAEALKFFNFAFGYDFAPCGFIDLGDKGFTPDGLDLKKNIWLELKAPLAHTHLEYLSGQVIPNAYFQQTQFPFLIHDFEKGIFGSYHPDFPALEIEIERDEKFLKLAEPILKDVCAEIKSKTDLLRKMIA